MEHLLHKAMALADGEMSPADLPQFLQDLARDPALVGATQTFMGLRPSRLAEVYASKAKDPVPQWLIDKVMTAPIASPARASAGILSIGSALIERLRDKYRVPGWSLAAGPAFASVLAIAAAALLLPGSRHEQPLMTAELQSALEQTASSRDTALPGFNPVLTYWSNDQAWCRQFEVQSGDERTSAVACRADNGAWRIVLQAPPAEVTGAPVSTPAGDVRTHLNRYVTSSRKGPALEPDQVRDAIRSRWQQPQPAPQ
jgi:hypothetical protein